MEKKELSAQAQDLLRAQIITEIEPGTVVRDFETLLQFIASHPLGATGQHDMFPMNCLRPLNELMVNPLPIKMKRPTYKSYPHLLTLFILARAGGFVVTTSQANERRLVLYEPVIQQWQSFNATERYFTLLNAYLWQGNKELIDGSTGWFGEIGLWYQISMELGRLLRDGALKVPADKKQENIVYSGYIPYYAFMELFGLITVKPGTPEEGKGWRIREIRGTTFGTALFELLGKADWRGFRAEEPLEEEANLTPTAVVLDQFQPDLQPYFPEWQHCLLLADDSGPREGVLQFKVSLHKAWRRITIDARDTFEDLSLTILDAFDFDNDHLHRFEYRNRFGLTQVINHPYMDEPPLSDAVTLSSLPIPIGGRMTYVFDFGDNWQFDVMLEKIDPPPRKAPKPKVIESHGKAPEQYPSWDEDDDE